MIEPFLLRAIAAAAGLAAIAAPFGCMVVWTRMAYFGETIANASLIGVALALLLKLDVTLASIAAAVAVAVLLALATRQTRVPMDSLLGVTAHGALALGLAATTLTRGPSVDLMGYLIGDVFAASTRDLMWIACGGALALTALARLWPKLLMLAIHSELAEAEGIDRDRTKAMFVVLLAVVVAVAIKIVGLLLVVAIFIMPETAARTFAATPERMVLLAAAIGVGGALAGLALSVAVDVPGGPAIVLVLAAVAALALTTTGRRAGPAER